MPDPRTYRVFAVVIALGTLLGCPSVPSNSFLAQPDGAAKFDLAYEPDLGLSSGRLEFELDPSRWGEAVKVAGQEVVAGDEAVTILVEEPFGADREVYLVRDSGARVAIPYVPYEAPYPAPRFSGPAIVPEYSPDVVPGGATWLHVVVGTRPKYGIKILVQG